MSGKYDDGENLFSCPCCGGEVCRFEFDSPYNPNMVSVGIQCGLCNITLYKITKRDKASIVKTGLDSLWNDMRPIQDAKSEDWRNTTV